MRRRWSKRRKRRRRDRMEMNRRRRRKRSRRRRLLLYLHFFILQNFSGCPRRLYTNTIFSTFVLQVLGGFDEMLMDERTYRRTDRRTVGHIDRRTDGQMKGRMGPSYRVARTHQNTVMKWKMDQQMSD